MPVFFAAARFRTRTPIIALIIAIGFGMWVSGRNETFVLNAEVARGIVGFFLGMVIGRLTEQRKSALILAVAYPAILTLGILMAKQIVLRYSITLDFSYAYVWLVFGWMLILLQTWPALQRPLAIRPLAFLGDLSLAVYLIHTPVQMILLMAAALTKTTLPLPSPFFWAGYVLLVLLSATLVHFGFERPARQWLRRSMSTSPFFSAKAQAST